MGHVCGICMGINPESCPANERQDMEWGTCPECGGSGETYWDDWSGERVSRDEWLLLPHDRQGVEVCGECGGRGEIECPVCEPDWDHEYC